MTTQTTMPNSLTEQQDKPLPTVVLVIGMAGSGKTTAIQRIHAHLHANKHRPYLVNLDPAVTHVPYEPNIDIRDTIKYTEVMKQYQLGPNGAILTSLNLFASKFNQVLDILQRRQDDTDYILIDTPGQIEAFTWSASGTIITETLATSFPTVILFVIDTPRSDNPATFMSNMLYACSIMYRTRLPFIVLFNKCDVSDADRVIEWVKDYDTFQSAILGMTPEGSDPPYMHSYVQSMSLVLEEFYSILFPVKFSAYSGMGCADLMNALLKAKAEYYTDFKPELDALVDARKRQFLQNKDRQIKTLAADIQTDLEIESLLNDLQVQEEKEQRLNE